MWFGVARFAKRKDFYKTRQWRELRYRVLTYYGGRCMACGKSAKDRDDAGQPVVLEVDHIKSRVTHPHLALSFRNLQVLCRDDNQGKGWKDATDWRPRR